jgi:hypothetical protein
MARIIYLRDEHGNLGAAACGERVESVAAFGAKSKPIEADKER